MSNHFLLEIGTEEIPAGIMPGLLRQIEQLGNTFLGEQKLPFTSLRAVGTPRRIALLISELGSETESITEKHKGPSISIAFDEEKKATKAAIGFARGKGVDVSELTIEDGYVYAHTHTSGRPVKDVVTNLVPYILEHLSFPKSMHWGDYDERFVRPVRWFVTLLNDEVIPYQMASAKSSHVSRGHRFLGQSEIVITHPESYIDSLRENYIIVDPKERRQIIVEQLESLADEHNASILWDADLLEEVLYLVEYPTALCGSFDESYLTLPAPAVITPMKDHQRYFPLVDKAGNLLPLFLTVRNGNRDSLPLVQAGNERVLRARLDDAVFFYQEDRKRSLEDRLEDLTKIVFQEGLGSVRDKTDRLIALSKYLGEACQLDSQAMDNLMRAALLAKTDLPTGMVVEFTELQGVIGKEYALLDGENESVAEAIYEQYLPRFAGDSLPQTDGGRILSIVDKVDTIVATFSRGLIPSGSQDPFALRRQTIGILNIIIDSGWDIHLQPLFEKAAMLLGVGDEDVKNLIEQVSEFFTLRLKNIYSDRQMPFPVAALLLSRKNMTVLTNEGLWHALQHHPIEQDVALVQAYTRIFNLVKDVKPMPIDESLLVDPTEITLYRTGKEVLESSKIAYANGDFATVINGPEQLVDNINEFFESVMVMDKNVVIRNNRLALLRMVYEVMALIGEVDALK